jgi:mannose-6-phosphate isomerase-like protein (cupin superfamily)
VLSGQGTTSSGEEFYPLAPGDTILIPPGEMHVTRNTGTGPLILICFFPVAAVMTRLEREAEL